MSVGAVEVREHEPLAGHTTLGTGGPARWFAEPSSIEELRLVLQLAAARGAQVVSIGLGSNLLVADDGFEGFVLKLSGSLSRAEVDRPARALLAGGGASLAVCLHRARAAALGGLEFACAIPGTVGGGVWMNAGAYGSQIADVLERALVVDAGGERWLDPGELGLEYRRSGLRRGQIVARARFRLEPRPPEEIRARVADFQARRKEAQPTNRRTFGSVFKNPLEQELTAGRLLDACGLRGFRSGGAQISPRHANFIENAGTATTQDALDLIAEARRRAQERFGVALEPEVQLLGEISIPPLG